MTSRFERLGMIDRGLLVVLIIATSSILLPMSAHAQESNQKIVFEIKTLQIPKTSDIADRLNGKDKKVATVAAPTPVPTPPPAKKVSTTTAKVSSKFPSKVIGDARVYMHEPEIRAYVCPKLGDRCNTFIAILKAENGTHECTRDNRGLNRNGSVDVGLAQINWTPNSSPYSFEQLQDCKFNLDIALQKVKARGFQPWYAYTKGAYLKHLPAVLASAKIIAATVPAAPITQ